jgi:hypothetical protein
VQCPTGSIGVNKIVYSTVQLLEIGHFWGFFCIIQYVNRRIDIEEVMVLARAIRHASAT